MFCTLYTLFFPFDIAANQTACHLNILKVYTWQVKNAPISNFLQLNQPAQNAAMRRQNHAAMRQAGGKTPPKAYKTMTEGKAHPTVEKAHPTEGKVQATEGKVQAIEGKVQPRIFAVRSAPTKDLRKSLGKVRAMPRLAAGKGLYTRLIFAFGDSV